MLIWIPLLVELSLLTLDVWQAYWTHAEMWNTAFDAVRQVAMGNFDATAATTPMQTLVEGYVGQQLGTGYAVTYGETAAYHTVTIDADVERMSLFGSLADVLPRVQASVTMLREP